MGFSLFEFICNFIFYLEFCVFLDSVHICRIRRVWLRYTIYICFVIGVLYISTLFPRMSVLRVMTLPVALMICNPLMYRDRLLRCIFTAWLVFGVIILSEVLVVALICQPEMLEARLVEAPLGDQALCWATELLCGAALYWLLTIILNRVRNRFGLREMLMYTFFPVSQCFLLFGWINAVRLSDGKRIQTLALIAAVLCLVADVGLFVSMTRVARQVTMEKENRRMAEEIGKRKAQYENLTAQYEYIRRLRHDIAKHIRAMDSLLAAGKSGDAARYGAELRETYAREGLGEEAAE